MQRPEEAHQFTLLTPLEIEGSTQILVIIGGPWCSPCNEARAAGVYSEFARIAGQHSIPFGELTVPSQGNLTFALMRKGQDASGPVKADIDTESSPTYQQLIKNYQAFRGRYDVAVANGEVDEDLRNLNDRWESMMDGVRTGETDLTRFLARIGVDVVPTLVYFENGQPVAYLQMPGDSEKVAFVTADRFTRRMVNLGTEDTVVLDKDAFDALDKSLSTRRQS